MKRGLITLTQLELSQLQTWLSQNPLPPLLIQKMQPLEDAAPAAQIEISEAEIEQLLDLLPAPSLNENPALSTLRKNLQEFLLKLRSF